MVCNSLEEVRTKTEEYCADPDMVEALYREMLSSFTIAYLLKYIGKVEQK